jgi:hypothetical protein
MMIFVCELQPVRIRNRASETAVELHYLPLDQTGVVEKTGIVLLDYRLTQAAFSLSFGFQGLEFLASGRSHE